MKRPLLFAVKYPTLDLVLAKSGDLDLSKYHTALEWATENIDDCGLGGEGDHYEERAKDRVSAYVSQYAQVMKNPTVELYRAVTLMKPEDLDLKKVGIHWSFEEDGAGSYGLNRETHPGEKEFVFTGTVNTKDISWEYGFTSFMWYGEDQWECAVNEGSPVTITAIDGKPLKKPLKGKI